MNDVTTPYPDTIEMYNRTYAHDGQVYKSRSGALKATMGRTDYVITKQVEPRRFVNYYAPREDVR